MAEDKMYIVRSFKVFLLLGFISAHAAVVEETTTVSCLDGWTKIHRGCYKFVTDVELSWTEARDKCKEESAELVVILSVSEKDLLQLHLIDKFPEGRTWWAGLNREETSGPNWRWLDGEAVIVQNTPWANTRAIARPGEFSGTLEIKSNKLVVGVSGRSNPKPYICEYHSISQRASDPPTPLPSPSEPLPTEPSYVADSAATHTPQEPAEQTPSSQSPPEGRPCVGDADGTDYGRLVKRLHSADDPLYRQYLQSEITANEAKVAYYQRVAGVYEAALQQQNQYYESSREKLRIETDILKKGTSCA